jgi:hypothetical protein
MAKTRGGGSQGGSQRGSQRVSKKPNKSSQQMTIMSLGPDENRSDKDFSQGSNRVSQRVSQKPTKLSQAVTPLSFAPANEKESEDDPSQLSPSLLLCVPPPAKLRKGDNEEDDARETDEHSKDMIAATEMVKIILYATK